MSVDCQTLAEESLVSHAVRVETVIVLVADTTIPVFVVGWLPAN